MIPEDTRGFVEREPVKSAAGLSIGVTAILTAFFLVARDLGINVPQDTATAITGAVIIVAIWLSNLWARGKVSPTSGTVER